MELAMFSYPQQLHIPLQQPIVLCSSISSSRGRGQLGHEMPTVTQDVELQIGPSRLWSALKESAVLFPKIAPQLFTGIEVVEGRPGEVGLVRLLKLGSVSPKGACVKEKLVFLDHDTWTVTTEEVEGGHLAHGYTKWRTTLKLIAIDEKRTKLTASFDYEGESKYEGWGGVKTMTVEKSKQGVAKLFHGVTAYIVANGAYAS